MVTRSCCGLFTLAALLLAAPCGASEEATPPSPKTTPEAAPAAVELFKAMDQGDVEVKFIAKSDHAGKVIITNKTDKPLALELPEAFAGVHVLAQRGGGGFGGGGGGNRGGGGGNQSTGGGFGGGGMGGGGGAFSIPPEKIAKLNVPLLCLEHGKRDPSSSNPYEIRPIDTVVERAEVIELLKAFGAGKLDHGAAQAAVWHLNNDLPWSDLASKRTGNARSSVRNPYFSQKQIKAGMTYAQEARRLAEENAKQRESQSEYASESEYVSKSEAEQAPEAEAEAETEAEAESETESTTEAE